MQRVVNGADRLKLDGSAAQPVQDPASKLIVAERATIVEADIPTETISREGMCQAADCLGLLKKQDPVFEPGQCGCGRHTAHARSDNNGIEIDR
jgi:hypothetical protein